MVKEEEVSDVIERIDKILNKKKVVKLKSTAEIAMEKTKNMDSDKNEKTNTETETEERREKEQKPLENENEPPEEWENEPPEKEENEPPEKGEKSKDEKSKKENYGEEKKKDKKTPEKSSVSLDNVVTSFGRGMVKGPVHMWKTLTHPTIFLIIVIVIHIFDALYLGFDRSVFAWIMAAIYLLVAFIALGIYGVNIASPQSGTFFLLSLIAWGLPFVTNRIFPTFPYLSLVLLFTPVWPLYVMYSSDTKEKSGKVAHAIGVIYLAIWVFLLIILVFTDFVVPSSLQTRGVDVKAPLQAFSDTVQDKMSRFWNRLTLGTGSVYTFFNKTMNPESYYYGTVEENKREQVGVFLEEIRSEGRMFFEGQPVTIYGKIKVKSFIDSPITITPWCRLATKRESATPTVEPQTITIQNLGGKSFYCKFDSLPSGIYPVVVSIEFPFETWAYIPITFVDKTKANAIYSSGKEVTEALDIDPTPKSVFTNGPVMLGMGGDDQPIIIDTEKPPYAHSFIGITLNNQWAQGKIKSVESIEIKVPKEIKLIAEKCDKIPEYLGEDKHDSELNTYIFKNPAGTEYMFTTITCPIEINSAEDAANLVTGIEKRTKTVVAVAKYRYEVEKKLSVNVK